MTKRPKMGFTVPVDKWLMYELRDLVESYLSQKAVQQKAVQNPEAKDNIKKRFYSGRRKTVASAHVPHVERKMDGIACLEVNVSETNQGGCLF
jgi:hypothetical protein